MKRSPRTGGGWAETAMRWLGTGTQVVEVSLAWWVATLLGLILFGHLPASVAAVSVLGRLGTDDASTRPLGDFVRAWRATLVRSTVVGWPATLALVVLGFNGWVLSLGDEPWMAPMFVVTVGVAACLSLGLAYVVPMLADERGRRVPVLTLWRAALGVCLVSPATAAAWAVSAAGLAVVAWRFPILVPLAVPGLVALLTAWLMRRRLDQTGVFAPEDSRSTMVKSA
ncbi:DUF624 domain-containing protein [Tessaracoccus sp. MC1865]|uniref:YesL family protein n=1 Tax=Tessaracoccus sp. MC1865 TaxID=2760310 RepID=UPI0016011B93|nr:DUF624 domain-containing protein [Tessaracoccus sp. MC1865]MBB1484418.1 DUF624 domain-containing protein [Tessaracoccus sp. MC1865]QTO38477.1 DUF624 domain-containing protein [Tessaracoccus sp. MC1865]